MTDNAGRSCRSSEEDRERVLAKIESAIFGLLLQIKENTRQPIVLKLPSSVGGKCVNFRRNRRRTLQMIVLFSQIQTLLVNGKYSTIRDIFYMGLKVFQDYKSLSSVVSQACDILEEERIYLNILSTGKGLIGGALRWIEENEAVDVGRGRLIPSETTCIHSPSSSASFILVVEKDAIFQKLIDEGFLDKYRAILITGKGYPDLGTRRMAKSLVTELGLPIFGLMDADPHGIEILCTYKFGPVNPGYENAKLEIPEMQWLGVFPTDSTRLPVGCDQKIALNDSELRKLRILLKRKELEGEEQLKTEIEFLLHRQYKLEIEAVSGLSQNYLTDRYIARMIRT